MLAVKHLVLSLMVQKGKMLRFVLHQNSLILACHDTQRISTPSSPLCARHTAFDDVEFFVPGKTQNAETRCSQVPKY